MADTVTAAHNKQNGLLLSVILLVTLAIAGYFSYSMTHHSTDLYTIPNPAQNQHQQKPITDSIPSTLSNQ